MTWLIVGLGNPGKEYASHRHNVGFMLVDELASVLRAGDFREKFSGRFTKASHGGEDIVLLEPLTFMNLSGQSVQPAAAFFKTPPAQVIVVHDEIDIPFGELRLKVGGGHAGHNGIRSITQSMGTPEFVRLRVGVGRPPPGYRGEVADYVLSSFDAIERAELPGILKRGTESVLDVLARGVTAATNKLNTKPKPSPRSGVDAEKKTASSGSGAASPRGKHEQNGNGAR
jgi:PTH1 family peptidyl-tRNA hydrolase